MRENLRKARTVIRINCFYAPPCCGLASSMSRTAPALLDTPDWPRLPFRPMTVDSRGSDAVAVGTDAGHSETIPAQPNGGFNEAHDSGHRGDFDDGRFQLVAESGVTRPERRETGIDKCSRSGLS